MDPAVVEEALAEGALAYQPTRKEHSRKFELDPTFLAEAEAVLAAGAAAIPEQKSKCCWFPFKNAYMARQRITDMSTSHLKDDHRRGGGGGSEADTISSAPQHDIGSTAEEEFDLERSPVNRSMLMQNKGGASPISVTSEIPMRTNNNDNVGGGVLDSNCIGKPELWVDEIVQGGPWSCVEESFQPNKKKIDGCNSVIKVREIEDHLEEYPTYPLPKVEVIHEELPYYDKPPSRGDRPRSRSPADNTLFGDSFDSNSLLDSLGSRSLLDDDTTHKSNQLRRAFCGRTSVDLIRPTNEARRKPDFNRSFDFPEEKKDDDSFSYEYTQNHSLIEEHMPMPGMRDFGTTSPHLPAAANEYSSDRLGWMKNLAASRGKKPMLCGPQRVDDMACKKRTFLTQPMSFDPRQYSRVQSTESARIPQLDPEDWGAIEEAQERPLSTHENLTSILKGGNGVGGDDSSGNNNGSGSSSSSTDLKVVRQTPSLVDMDSAFMGSEDKSEHGDTACGPRRGYFPSSLQLKARSRSRQGKQELETLHEGSLESNSNNSNSNSESSSKSTSQDFERNSNDSGSVSDHDHNDWEDSTTSDSTSSSFRPPPVIKSRVRSGRKVSTSINSRRLSKPGVEGRGKNDRDNGKIKSENKRSVTSEVDRRSRSFGTGNQQQRQHGEEMVEFFVPEQGRSHHPFQQEPINALSTARVDEGYNSFHNANGRDYNGDYTASTTNQRLGLPLKHEYSTMSNDFGAFLATNGNDDGDRIFTTYPRRSSQFQRPHPEGLKDLPFQPSDCSGMQRTEPAAQKNPRRSSSRSKSPRRLKAAPIETVQSPLNPKPAEDFFDDVSDLGTDAFRQYQTDEEDSIFDGIRSDESSAGGGAAVQQAEDPPPRHKNGTGTSHVLDGEALYERARLDRIEKARLDRIWTQETDFFAAANKKDEFAWKKWMDS